MTADPGALVGLPWAEVEPMLAARGLTVRTREVHPPGRPGGEGEIRVVGVRQTDAGLLILLAHRSYALPPPAGGAAPDTPTAR